MNVERVLRGTRMRVDVDAGSVGSFKTCRVAGERGDSKSRMLLLQVNNRNISH